MKYQRKTSFLLAVFITLSLLAGCGNSQREASSQQEGSSSNDSKEILSAADTRRDEFYHRMTDVEVAGRVYYVSNSGDDNTGAERRQRRVWGGNPNKYQTRGTNERSEIWATGRYLL